MYIYNANVITMAEKNYENGFILIENDKIKAVGDMSQLKDFSPSEIGRASCRERVYRLV